ncbi:MAG: lamin tail domain-containing protein, partial [Paludibacteraceae bacterium]|nr:lamin tail domain-containing protein [Paludibacteraceae bacterium]
MNTKFYILLLFLPFSLFADNYVIFNQIMYDSPLNEKVTEPPYSNGEFIELYNGGTDSVNLKNWLIKGDGTTEVYIFDSLILA